MARPATGQVVRPTPGQPCFALRFRAYGKREYLTLGKPEDGWTLAMAQRELAVVLRDVDLGTWRPPRPDPAPAKNTNPTFHEFASDWFAAKQLEIEKNTASSYGNDLTNHLLPFFKDHHISEITVAEVDRYRQSKVREAAEITAAAENGTPLTVSYVDRLGRSYRRRARPLSARSINMHIDLLAQILAVAVDHGHIAEQPGGRQAPPPEALEAAARFTSTAPSRSRSCSRPPASSTAAKPSSTSADRHGRTWTQRHPVQTTGRRAAIATLLLGGGRASATGAMLWRDVDLANGRFEVGRDKTDAGMREVDMLPLLREILTEHKAASERTGPDDPVFVTSAGKPRSRHNIRQDVVDAVVAHANRLVEERGLQPLPLGITPHKLRHTFASILVAIGKDPTYVMQQLGHTDPAFTLRVYAHVMRRSEEERERLKALVEGHVWAVNGQYAPDSAPQTHVQKRFLTTRKAPR